MIYNVHYVENRFSFLLKLYKLSLLILLIIGAEKSLKIFVFFLCICIFFYTLLFITLLTTNLLDDLLGSDCGLYRHLDRLNILSLALLLLGHHGAEN